MQGDVSIKIVGVGGGGCRCASDFVEELTNAVCIAMDTDEASLMAAKAHEKILLGKTVTRSSSTGGDVELASKVLSADIDLIKNSINACDIVFIMGSLGGGTGSVIAPEVAKIARQAGAITIAFCTLPSSFEGSQKQSVARRAMGKMTELCDMAVALANEDMLMTSQSDLKQALEDANRCVRASVSAICNMLAKTGLINLDIGALKNLFKEKLSNKTLFAYARSDSQNKVNDALEKLKNFPALKTDFAARRASKLIASITCASDTSIQEIKEVLSGIADTFSDTTEVLFGAVLDESYKGAIEVFAMGVAAAQEEPRQEAKLELPSKVEKPEPQLRRRKLSSDKKRQESNSQSEFGFVDVELKRGFFEDTEPNLYGKEDLDVPTFMRRKIKIHLKKI